MWRASMEYFSFGSGSKGNCILVKNQDSQIMIDCGINKGTLMKGIEKYQLDFSFDGILFTHHHSDHVRGSRFVEQFPFYAPFYIEGKNETHEVIPYHEFQLGSFTITPIKLSHDAKETVGYMISDGKETLVQATDTGYYSQTNFELTQNADYYIFESNHDVEMLMNTERPAVLKARIISDNGHMNNVDTGNVLSGLVGKNTKEIALAHLSEEANTPELALSTVTTLMKGNGIGIDSIRFTALEQYGFYHGGNHD